MSKMKEFIKAIGTEYERLYEAENEPCGYRIAVWAFDEFAKQNKEFICEVVKERGDYISSDREAAAFMFAAEKFGIV